MFVVGDRVKILASYFANVQNYLEDDYSHFVNQGEITKVLDDKQQYKYHVRIMKTDGNLSIGSYAFMESELIKN